VRLPVGPPRAMVIFLHGGFWRQEYDRGHAGPLAAALAAAGYVAITPEFRRTGAPGGGWPGTLDDVAAAVRAVPELVTPDHVTPGLGEPILAGHSAGGQLALWAAAGLAREGRPPRGVVALAPVADLVRAFELDLGGGAVLALLGGRPDEVPDRYAAADPIVSLPIGAPVIVGHGDRDVVVPLEISERFVRAARVAGDDVTLAAWEEADHFDVIDPESAVWPNVLTCIERLCAPPGPH
jgi:acetyl esterase/lipase